MAGQVPEYSATSPCSPLVNSNPLYSNTSRVSHGMEGAGWRGGASYSDARSPLREQADYGVSLPPEDCMSSTSRHGPWENHNNGGVNVSVLHSCLKIFFLKLCFVSYISIDKGSRIYSSIPMVQSVGTLKKYSLNIIP